MKIPLNVNALEQMALPPAEVMKRFQPGIAAKYGSHITSVYRLLARKMQEVGAPIMTITVAQLPPAEQDAGIEATMLLSSMVTAIVEHRVARAVLREQIDKLAVLIQVVDEQEAAGRGAQPRPAGLTRLADGTLGFPPDHPKHPNNYVPSVAPSVQAATGASLTSRAHARVEGAKANQAGLPRTANPYPRRSEAYAWWLAGWRGAEDSDADSDGEDLGADGAEEPNAESDDGDANYQDMPLPAKKSVASQLRSRRARKAGKAAPKATKEATS